MEQDPDPRDLYDCRSVLAMLEMAKEAERRKPRRPLAVRARAIAERYLDQMEKDPEIEPEMLAWVLKMLEAAREEVAMGRGAPRGEAPTGGAVGDCRPCAATVRGPFQVKVRRRREG